MNTKAVLRFLILLSLISNASSLLAQSRTFIIRKEDSQIGFAVYKWMVIKEEGRFKDFAGTIVYDPNNPSASAVEITVATASIDSRIDGRDNALRSADFFHVAKYPQLAFKSVSVQAKGADTLLVAGDLTMHGITKRITVPVKVHGINHVDELGEVAGFEASFTINREDFGIGQGWNIISKEATIQLMIGAASTVRSARP